MVQVSSSGSATTSAGGGGAGTATGTRAGAGAGTGAGAGAGAAVGSDAGCAAAIGAANRDATQTSLRTRPLLNQKTTCHGNSRSHARARTINKLRARQVVRRLHTLVVTVMTAPQIEQALLQADPRERFTLAARLIAAYLAKDDLAGGSSADDGDALVTDSRAALAR